MYSFMEQYTRLNTMKERVSCKTTKYRKVYKGRGLCAVFPLCGAASIQVRLLFEGGLYAKFWVCKSRKSGLAHVKMKRDITIAPKLFQM